jgi:hypothetical protein
MTSSTSFPAALYVAYHIGFGNPPPALPDKERTEDVDYTPTLIDAMRWSLASARQVEFPWGRYKAFSQIDQRD